MSGARVFLVGRTTENGDIVVASRIYLTQTEAAARARMCSGAEPDAETVLIEAEIDRMDRYMAGKRVILG